MSKLVGYEWKTESGEKFSAYDGGLVACKVSDWNQAEKSQLSGRTIVHIYWIEKDGQLLPYGKNSAMKELGIKAGTLKNKAEEYMTKARRQAENHKHLLKSFELMQKHSSVELANDAYVNLNYSPLHTPRPRISYLENTACYCRNGEYVTRMNTEENNRALTELNFTKVIEN
jgi:hypothetical protein